MLLTQASGILLGTTQIFKIYRGSTLVWQAASQLDVNTLFYVDSVQKADGQALESTVISAMNTFITGCKADGTWSGLQSSCLMAGPRTLTGALQPLMLGQPGPTNYNFNTNDYNRTSGIHSSGTRAGTAKFLDTNRRFDADGFGNQHMAVYVTKALAGTSTYMGIVGATNEYSSIGAHFGAAPYVRQLQFYCQNSKTDYAANQSAVATGYIGINSIANYVLYAQYGYRFSQSDHIASNNSTPYYPPITGTAYVFSRGNYLSIPKQEYNCSATLSYYSFGPKIPSQSLLDSRITQYMQTIQSLGLS